MSGSVLGIGKLHIFEPYIALNAVEHLDHPVETLFNFLKPLVKFLYAEFALANGSLLCRELFRRFSLGGLLLLRRLCLRRIGFTVIVAHQIEKEADISQCHGSQQKD